MILNRYTYKEKLLCLVLLTTLSACNSKETSSDISGEDVTNDIAVAAETSRTEPDTSASLHKKDVSEIPGVVSEVAGDTKPAATASKKPIQDAAEPAKVAQVKIVESSTPLAPNSPPPGFAICSACHTMEKGGGTKLGPNLFGIYGSPSAKKVGFAYSDALKNSNIVWTKSELDAYLLSPQGKVPGTKMSFGGIKDAEKRAKFIEYLTTFQ